MSCDIKIKREFKCRFIYELTDMSHAGSKLKVNKQKEGMVKNKTFGSNLPLNSQLKITYLPFKSEITTRVF